MGNIIGRMGTSGGFVGRMGGSTSKALEQKINEVDSRVDTIITTPVEGVSAQEIIDARHGKGSLGTNISEIKSELAETEKQPDKYTGIGTGSTFTINQAFPSVTLAEVQALDPQATLSNKADWFVLQKLINDATANKKKRLNYIEGTFIIDRPISIVQKLGRNWFIEATGCTIKASTGYTGKMLILDKGNDHATSRNGRIKGLTH